ncbi:hypothetical protein JAAARDRAFT_683245 [Jaapia argillacea MUCL 33604]|uniref:Uncharacterized protein n=1 Tax=Jaapia argillacea MUCL 33604 TaxID=933084 RepID=A0A067QAZ5_9AGAM|nr:hypothetical protein JAAARDRAFT_683245 [Jaapia argillacea MUCL 33604]
MSVESGERSEGTRIGMEEFEMRQSNTCRLLREVVDLSVELQYKIELDVTKMSDNPSSNLSVGERLSRLKAHQEAWKNLEWRQEVPLPPLDPDIWELQGGVLAQGKCEQGLTVTQLGGDSRGIPTREWDVKNLGFAISDLAMDPAQDLLVLIEVHDVQGPPVPEYVCRTHLRKLSSGQPHNLASWCPDGFLTHQPEDFSPTWRYKIQIAGQMLGLAFGGHELVVWNWMTGTIMRRLTSNLWWNDCDSFAFISDKYLALAHPDSLGPCLKVFSMDIPSDTWTTLEAATPTCTFHYPHLKNAARTPRIRIDSSTSRLPPPNSNVPFYANPESDIMLLTLDDHVDPLFHVIPTACLLKHAKNAASTLFGEGLDVLWEEWGSETRFLAKEGRDRFMLCVSGTKFALSKAFTTEDDENTLSSPVIMLYDFNPIPLRRELASSVPASNSYGSRSEEEVKEERNVRLVMRSTLDIGGKLWKKPPVTCLPYRQTTAVLPKELAKGGGFRHVMMSEDALILVAHVGRSDVAYGVLTF